MNPIEGAKAEGVATIRAVLVAQSETLKELLAKTMSSYQHRLLFDAIQQLQAVTSLLEKAS